ncbi:ABC transporter permease [Sphingobacteriales bacterium UPWRP_1]|nr:hypothetical protein B6N25_07765 [Sphingobacteriales bacterium TSM_CSS]PSJ75517.1 ABC transporter permease [Sphingobacteriales bacterium UPWRP_1]
MFQTVIDADNHDLRVNFGELYRYRELLLIFAYRDIKAKYSQTYLGLFWSFVTPVLTLLTLSVVFNRIIQIETVNIPYPLFLLSGWIVWAYFSGTVASSGSSILDAQRIIQKVYFPRLLVPLSKLLVGLTDFAIGLLFIFILLVYFKHPLQLSMLYLPVFIVLTLLLNTGISVWASALIVRYRDMQQIVNYGLYLLFYLTPVFYPTAYIPEQYKTLFYLNPLVGLTDGYRWCLLGGEYQYWQMAYICIMSVLFCVSGVWYFKKTEKIMTDIL